MAKEKSKILIVEDDKYYRRAYKDGLEDAGFSVTLANDGKDGLEKAKSEHPDLILLDLIMPIEGGFDVLAEVKTDDALKDIPIIILSNLGQDSDVEKTKALGAVDYLIKSDVTMKEVLTKVKFYLAKKK